MCKKSHFFNNTLISSYLLINMLNSIAHFILGNKEDNKDNPRMMFLD